MKTRLRFSIRSLLIAVALISAIAAVYRYRAHRVEIVRDFVETAESAGVDVEVVWWPDQHLCRYMDGKKSEMLSRKFGFPRLRAVSALYPSDYANWFEKLLDCGGAESVDFVGSDFSREHVDALSRLDTVKELKFCTEQLATEIGPSLGRLSSLESLEFRGAGMVSQETIQSFCELPSLRYLETDVDLEAVSYFPDFQSSHCITGLTLRLVDAPQPYPWHVLSKYSSLRSLELDGASTDENIETLVATARGLRRLAIDLHGASPEGCELMATLPVLERLEIVHLPGDADALAGLSRLTELRIRDSVVSTSGLRELHGCPIKTLELLNIDVRGDFSEGISRWRHLESIELIGTNVTEAEAAQIRKTRALRALHIRR